MIDFMRHKIRKNFCNAQQLELFSPKEFVKRPKPDQEVFEKLVLPYTESFKKAYDFASRKLADLHRELPVSYFLPRFDSMFFNGLFIGHLKTLIGNENFGRTAEGREYLQLGDYIVFFKKVDDDLTPKNIKTLSSSCIDAQYAKKGSRASAVVYIGYKPSDFSWEVLDGIFAIYRDVERGERWTSDLLMLQSINAVTNSSSDAEYLFVQEKIDNTEPRVKIRKPAESIAM